MTRAAVVVRPAPGDAATAALLADHGLRVIRLPLFAVVPLPWTPPGPDYADAILFTSANAPRHAGAALDTLRHLPVVAVGAATAHAARQAGFAVALTGDSDAAAAARSARAAGFARLLHLGGRERIALPDIPGIAVYASEAVEPSGAALADAIGHVILLHSPRAARAIARLIADRATTRIAALSPAVAAAAGDGWERLACADIPSDPALVALAHVLAIDP